MFTDGERGELMRNVVSLTEPSRSCQRSCIIMETSEIEFLTKLESQIRAALFSLITASASTAHLQNLFSYGGRTTRPPRRRLRRRQLRSRDRADPALRK